jgi:predicted heme/steroid binding protein
MELLPLQNRPGEIKEDRAARRTQAFIAGNGAVHTISECPQRAGGMHEVSHSTGQNFKEGLGASPRDMCFFTKPCAKPVGLLECVP